MTLDLEAIKARLVGLPEGPWHSRGADDQCFTDNNQHGAISHFIAHARADVPALIADVPALIAEVERLRSLLYLTVTTANTLADELESEIKSHYQGVGHYPIEARRLERDLDVVVQARAVLPEL